jgi:glycosyltransferase involved in cell wall biosynthesis
MPTCAFLAPRFAPDLGGVAVSATRIAHRLSALGWTVEVFAPSRRIPAGTISETPQSDGLRLITVGSFAKEDSTHQHLLSLIEDRHHEQPYDLLWGHYLSTCGFLAALLGRRLDIPSIVAARGNDVDRELLPPGDFARLRWTLEAATRVVSVSADLARTMAALVPGIGPVVLRNVVDSQRFAPKQVPTTWRSDLGMNEEDCVIGFCGELRQKKGAPYLLDAFAEVAAARPTRLLIIGDLRERDREYLERLALADPDLAQRVVVTGHIEDQEQVATHLNGCDVIALPSLWDGLPNALLEAMACARPVVASTAGGIPEACTHGSEGLLLQRSELPRLGEALLEVLELPEEQRQRLGQAARQRMIRDFAPEQEAESLQALLASVAGAASSPS